MNEKSKNLQCGDEDQSNLFHDLMPLNGPLNSIFTEHFRILFVHSDGGIFHSRLRGSIWFDSKMKTVKFKKSEINKVSITKPRVDGYWKNLSLLLLHLFCNNGLVNLQGQIRTSLIDLGHYKDLYIFQKFVNLCRFFATPKAP